MDREGKKKSEETEQGVKQICPTQYAVVEFIYRFNECSIKTRVGIKNDEKRKLSDMTFYQRK